MSPYGMAPTIKAACWLDLMSYDAMEAYRDLEIDMGTEEEDLAIAVALRQQEEEEASWALALALAAEDA